MVVNLYVLVQVKRLPDALLDISSDLLSSACLAQQWQTVPHNEKHTCHFVTGIHMAIVSGIILSFSVSLAGIDQRVS